MKTRSRFFLTALSVGALALTTACDALKDARTESMFENISSADQYPDFCETYFQRLEGRTPSRTAIARFNLGFCAEEGIGIPRSVDEALRWYELAARNGNKHAMGRAWRMKLLGMDGMRCNPLEVMEWLEADLKAGGSPEAAYQLARILEGKAPDHLHVVREERRAAEGETGAAPRRPDRRTAALAETVQPCLEVQVTLDEGRALELYETAAAEGIDAARLALADKVRTGKLNKVLLSGEWAEARKASGTQAEFLPMLSAWEIYEDLERETHDLGVMAAMGDILERGLLGQARLVEAAQWYDKAARGGDPFAMLRLAGMYRDGRGVEASVSKATDLYLAAVGQDYVPALRPYGLFLWKVASGHEDRADAMSHMTKAANTGDRDAWKWMVDLAKGEVKLEGQLPEDEAKKAEEEENVRRRAVSFMDEALRQKLVAVEGNEETFTALGAYHLERGGLKQAKRWLRPVADKGSAAAMYQMGSLEAQEGRLESAETWFRKAASAGYSDGYYGLAMVELGHKGLSEDDLKKAVGHLVMSGENGRRWLSKAYVFGASDGVSLESLGIGGRNGLKGLAVGSPGEPLDDDGVMKWARDASARGVAAGDAIVAVAKLDGTFGMEKDEAEGMKLLADGAVLGDIEARRRLLKVLEDNADRLRREAEKGRDRSTSFVGLALGKRKIEMSLHGLDLNDLAQRCAGLLPRKGAETWGWKCLAALTLAGVETDADVPFGKTIQGLERMGNKGDVEAMDLLVRLNALSVNGIRLGAADVCNWMIKAAYEVDDDCDRFLRAAECGASMGGSSNRKVARGIYEDAQEKGCDGAAEGLARLAAEEKEKAEARNKAKGVK